MTNRQEWDRPAMVIALVMGVVVVGASLPFAVIAFCKEEGCGEDPVIPSKFDITWGEVVLVDGAGEVEVNDAAPAAQAVIPVADKLLSHARIVLGPDACIDTHNATFRQEPASFQYALVRRLAGSPDEPVAGASGSFTCEGETKTQGFSLEVDLRLHPDIAVVEANTTEEAVERAWAANAANDTADYVLLLLVERPEPGIPIPGGLPVADTEMAATMQVQLFQWGLAANEQPEVVR